LAAQPGHQFLYQSVGLLDMSLTYMMPSTVVLQVKDYPGLLRVIAWVINGVDLIVENAK